MDTRLDTSTSIATAASSKHGCETQGIIEGGEYRSVPDDRIGLFLLRTKTTVTEKPHRGGLKFGSRRPATPFAFAV